MNPTDILTPQSAAQLVADSAVELLMPFVGMLLVVVLVFMFKDFAMKFGKGLAFSLNSQFKEGDRVIIDDERAIIVKIGLTQTVFGISKVKSIISSQIDRISRLEQADEVIVNDGSLKDLESKVQQLHKKFISSR